MLFHTKWQWRKNALEWCYSDGNHELAKELYKLPQEEVIQFISFLWALEFKKVRKDKKIDQSDIEAYEDKTLDEFYHSRFDYREGQMDLLKSEKENLTRTLEECGEIISQAKEIVEWLLTHNKNYTNKQYNKLLELQEILDGE